MVLPHFFHSHHAHKYIHTYIYIYVHDAYTSTHPHIHTHTHVYMPRRENSVISYSMAVWLSDIKEFDSFEVPVDGENVITVAWT